MSVLKIMKTFGPNSGVATILAEIVDNKKWRSAWVVISPLTANVLLIETSQLICSANQLTGFYMMGTLAVKGLTLANTHGI